MKCGWCGLEFELDPEHPTYYDEEFETEFVECPRCFRLTEVKQG